MSGALNSVFGGGNILGMVMNIASMAFPALQLANSMFNMLSQAVGSAITSAVDQLVQQGMPKFIGNAIKDLVGEVLGNNQKPSNPQVDQAMQDRFGDQMETFIDNLTRSIVDDVNQQREESSGGSGKGGWLVALAKAFGRIADKAARELEQAGKNLNNENPSEMIEYQAKAQEFSQMMNTFVNAIKTIGEANAQAVRKG
jgi:hypothetical protein